MISRRGFLGAAGVVLVPGPTAPAAAQAAFPTRPIRLIVSSSPGGGTDTIARLVADKVARAAGQPVVVENRGGGGGSAALGLVRTQPADGHAIAWAPTAVVTFNAQLEGLDLNMDQFALIMVMIRRSFGLLARADQPYRDWDGFVRHVKAKGSFSAAMNNITQRLAMQVVARQLGVRVNTLMTRGGAESRAQLLGGHVDVIATGSAGFVDTRPGGPFQFLASMDDERSADYPAVPTLMELGFDVAVNDHGMLVAPAGTAAPIVARLYEIFAAALDQPDVKRVIDEAVSATPFVAGAEEGRRIIAAELGRFQRLIRAAG